MTDKLDAATIRDWIARIDADDSFDPQKIACLGSYALELSDENERLKILAGRDAAAMMSDIMMQRHFLSKEVEELTADRAALTAQLQSQAAELERLRRMVAEGITEADVAETRFPTQFPE